MKWYKRIFWTKWKVARTVFPYPDGWGVYRENWVTREKLILDTGIPDRQTAEDVAAFNNKVYKN